MNPLISLLSGLTGGQNQPQQKPTPQSGGGNPLMELLTAMASGQNAMKALTNILPQAAQIMNNHGGQNMEQFVRNEYQNRGVDINVAMQQLQEMMGTMNANNYGGQNTNNNYGGQNNSGSTNNTNNNMM